MRLLIVEDQDGIRESLVTSFKSESFTVDSTDDGNRGLFLACTNEYDAIILDLVLPHKNGLEICQELRSRGRTAPIIILSVRSGTHEKVDVLNSGADDYVTKPFVFSELLARVHAVMRRPRAMQGEVLTVGDVELHVGEQRVTRAGKEVYLTRKEFELLEYLMRHQGRTVSRAMILEHVWDMNADPFSNTLETHILNLRRKVDPDGTKLIQTVPTRGYKINRIQNEKTV